MKNRIKEIRLEMGMTQEELAKRTGISRPALSMIESGKSCPDGRTIASLVVALDTPANRIFFEFDVVQKQHRKADEA